MSFVRLCIVCNFHKPLPRTSSSSSGMAQRSMSTAPAPRQNLVAVMGTTGVGKSQLGVELALSVPKMSFDGFHKKPLKAEILNTDSMQIYEGLDVITNKATKEEMKGIPHRLMDFLRPGDDYNVGEFKSDALREISSMHEECILPIAVGGTAYYLQNLIFPNQLAADLESSMQKNPSQGSDAVDSSSLEQTGESSPLPRVRSEADLVHIPQSLRESIKSLPTELLELFYILPSLPQSSSIESWSPGFPIHQLPERYQKETPEEFGMACYSILIHVDPKGGKRWHWRDLRKVRRWLEIVWEGRRSEDVFEEQSGKRNEGARYKTIVFWPFAEKLGDRLDARVDQMVERGLLDEIDSLWQKAKEDDRPTNYTIGIYQAIGFKEFEPYMRKRQERSDTCSTKSPSTDPLFKVGLEAMKISTRQYSRRQLKWIKSKFLSAVKRAGSEHVILYILDASDLSKWDENVRDPAVMLLEKFLKEEALPDPVEICELAAIHLKEAAAEQANAHQKRQCEICSKNGDVFMVEERQWYDHVTGHRHRQSLKKEKAQAAGSLIRWDKKRGVLSSDRTDSTKICNNTP